MKTYNNEIADAFHEIGDLLAILNENPFRIRAYHNAGRVLKEAVPVTKKGASEKKFKELPGIGDDLAKKMVEYIETGQMDYLNKLRDKVPKAVRDLLKIPHLGPNRVRDLYINLGIKTKEELLNAASSGEIEEIPGFGPKLVDQIVEAIKKGQQKKKRHERKDIKKTVNKIVKILKDTKGVKKVEVAGSYRRKKPTVGDIDILIQGDAAANAAEKNLKKEFDDVTMIASGETKVSFVIFPDNLQVDIRFVPKESWGAALLYFTGSKDYNVMMRRVAIDKGYLLNEYGLFDNGEYIAGKTEEEVFKKLDLSYVPPEKRK